MPDFLGLDEAQCSYKDAQIVILPVPFEMTTSYAKGTSRGPEAILEASEQVELYDEELDLEPYQAGIATLPELDFVGMSLSEAMSYIEEQVAKISQDGKIPFMLGGEHSITAPAVRAVGTSNKDAITVVQLDAHADLRQQYEGTPFSHASVMARVREKFPAVQIGIRSLSKEEADWIKSEKLPVFYAHVLRESGWQEKALAAVKTEKVYLTIDIDALDSAIMPDTGTPEPGGMTFVELTSFVKKLMESKQVVGLDLVELMPQEGRHASDFLAARLASKCIGYWLAGK